MTTAKLFPRAPAAIIERLQAREQSQRAETKKRGLPAEPVCVEGLLLLQRNLCGCGCGEPLDFESAWNPKNPPPGFPVVAHRLCRGSRGGHVVGNVFIDRTACNARDARDDNRGAASVKRFTPDMQRKLLGEEKPASKWPKRKMENGRGFDRSKTRGFDGKVRERG